MLDRCSTLLEKNQEGTDIVVPGAEGFKLVGKTFPTRCQLFLLVSSRSNFFCTRLLLATGGLLGLASSGCLVFLALDDRTSCSTSSGVPEGREDSLLVPQDRQDSDSTSAPRTTN